MAALATALDTKGQSFDTDVARLAKRKWVKVSHTSFNYDNNEVIFDTVENNNGTPTDLTLDPFRIQLAAGFYVLQAKMVVPTITLGGNYALHIRGGGSPVSIASPSDTTSRDFGSSTSPTTIDQLGAVYIATGIAKVAITLNYPTAGPTIPITYASLAAWWVSDA
jgi:hypothetical protein